MENFLFNLLHTLSDSEDPIVKIPVGADGSGIYVVREKADGKFFDYGARLMITDIKVGDKAKSSEKSDSPPPEISLQIGKWIAGEKDKDSWVARSLGQKENFAQPGVSIYLLRTEATAGECSSTGPNLTFKPRVELVSLGLDVHGGAGQPLFDISGYTMAGVAFGGGVSIRRGSYRRTSIWQELSETEPSFSSRQFRKNSVVDLAFIFQSLS